MCMLKSANGAWGRFWKAMAIWPVVGIGGDGAGELDVDAEAVEDEEDAEAVAGLGFAEVDGAGERPGEDRGFDRERADLGVLGALGFFGGAEAGFGVGAGRLAVGDVGGEGEAIGKGDAGGLAARRARARWGSRTGER